MQVPRLPALLLMAGSFLASARAATLPVGFVETEVASLSGNPTAMEISPDKKLFVTQQNGVMPVWKDGAELAANFFSNAPLVVDSSGERGLLGIAFDPNFSTNRFVYVYYTVNGGDHRNRVSRFTSDASGNRAVAGSELVIWESDPHSAANHNGGAIHFGPDGKLYIATGDNAEGSAVAQSLRSQHGKILRINANGTIPLDNPFHDSTGPNCDAIWSLGLRNPFTFAFQRGSGRMFVNDVGENSWEEINDGGTLQSGRGLNYGWAATEGNFNQVSFPNFTRPFYAYGHGTGTPSGAMITGGVFYDPASGSFGGDYKGDYFFADLAAGWIYRLDINTRQPIWFASGAGAVDLKVGDDGSLYYLSLYLQKVFRVTYAGGTAPTITGHPENRTVGLGQPPVVFSVETTGGPAFQWQRSNDNGTTWNDIPGATSKTYSHTAVLSDNGALFRVKAAHPGGTATSNPGKLTVINNYGPNAPVITISGGLSNDLFVAGQTVSFSGTASDPEEGALPASSFRWTINYVTAIRDGILSTGTSQTFRTVNGAKSGTFVPTTTGSYTKPYVAYIVTLEVSDSQGFKSSASKVLYPKITTINLSTAPWGLQLTVDGEPLNTGVTNGDRFESVAGFQHVVGAPLTQSREGILHNFASWSDGGAASHAIPTLSNAAYVATYTVVSAVPSPWLDADVGAVGTVGQAGFKEGTFTLLGSGALEGSADAFHYVYQKAAGNCSITACVTYFNSQSGNSRAGVMIRESLTPGSPHMFMGQWGGEFPQIVYRNKTGSPSDAVKADKFGGTNYWVRVTRQRNTLTAFRSSNGKKWTKAFSRTIKMGDDVYIGLAVCSGGPGLLKVTFLNVAGIP